MNKLNSGKTVTIKINGKQRPFFEDSPKEELLSVENIKNQLEDVSLNDDQEAIVETAASQEAEESFDWILPEQETSQNELSLHKPTEAPKQRKGIRLPALSNVEKKNASTLKSIALSVFFAVLLGTGFGIAMLKLVITDSSKPAAVQTTAQPAAKKDLPVNNSKSSGVTTVKPLIANMVQGGVYSKKGTAQKTAGQIIEKGIPAEIMGWNGQYYIFLGVADSLEHARSLGIIFQDKGMDGVFAKPVTIPEKKFTNLSVAEKNVIENAIVLVPLLANLSSKRLIGGSISTNELKSLSQLTSKQTKIDSNAVKNKQIKDLNLEITGAMKQISDYQQKKDHKLLEKAQQHLLTFLADYYSL